MMPASNQGVGNNIGFPDVCLTPMAPSPVPIPYPNIGSNALSVPFCANILFSFMPAHNQYAKPAITNGDEAGCNHPMFIQSGGNNLGNIKTFLMGGPAETLLNPCQGNNYNCFLDAKLVPSVVNILITYCPPGAGWDERARRAAGLELRDLPTPGLGVTLAEDGGLVHVRRGGVGDNLGLRAGDRIDAARLWGELLELAVTRGGRGLVLRGLPRQLPAVSGELLPGGIGHLTLRRFSLGAPAQLDAALASLRDARALLLDLRGNPGGALEVARDVASRFLPAGRLLATATVEGKPRELVTDGAEPCQLPLVVWVDRGTASAAEALAAALIDHGRGTLVGAPTLGKGHGLAARLGETAELGARCEVQRADGQSLGVLVPAAPASNLQRALALTEASAR